MLQKLSTATRMFDKMEPNKQPWHYIPQKNTLFMQNSNSKRKSLVCYIKNEKNWISSLLAKLRLTSNFSKFYKTIPKTDLMG